MTGVFLSYTRPDVRKAELLAKRLSNAGVSVWRDTELRAGDDFCDQILQQIDAARAVVVLWSDNSVNSAWVLSEADHARKLGRLLPVRLDNVQVPLGFTRYQTADLSDWSGQDDHPGWQALLIALRELAAAAPKSAVATNGNKAPTPLEATLSAPTADTLPDIPGRHRKLDPSRSYPRPTTAKNVRVFIAHAAIDKPLLRGPLEILIDTGFDVWIDKPQRVGLSERTEAKLRHGRIKYGEDVNAGVILHRRAGAIIHQS